MDRNTVLGFLAGFATAYVVMGQSGTGTGTSTSSPAAAGGTWGTPWGTGGFARYGYMGTGFGVRPTATAPSWPSAFAALAGR